jgi:SAM-dependent methyltransferase
VAVSGTGSAPLTAAQRARRLRKLHDSPDPLRDDVVDRLLDLRPHAAETNVRVGHERARWGDESFGYEGTPYDVVREGLRCLEMRETDRLYDLGSGYGRVVLYGALTGPGRYHGVEIVAARVAESERCRRLLGLDRRAFFSQGNAADFPFPDATAFFLFNPFVPDTFQVVARRMRELSRHHPIRIASYGPSGDRFARLRWLGEIPIRGARHAHRFGLRLFRSR